MSSAIGEVGNHDPDAQRLGGNENLQNIVSRLNTFIEKETEEIRDSANINFVESSERKNRLLFELNRVSRSVDFETLALECIENLRQLKENLKENEVEIRAHLSAVREVSGIMIDLIKAEEADGTYKEYC